MYCSDSGTGTSTQPTKAAQKDKEPMKDKVAEDQRKLVYSLLPFQELPLKRMSQLFLALEELTGYDVSLQFLLNSSYEDHKHKNTLETFLH